MGFFNMENKVPNYVDVLIYENINKYRLHADNLRFSLFTGYFAVIATAIYYFTNIQFRMSYCILILIISILFMLIISIQNWFYVLFAQFMNDCEEKLVNGIALTTLNDYAKKNGQNIKPSHPAFNFIMIIFSLLEGYLLYLIIINGFPWNKSLIDSKLFNALIFLMASGIFILQIIICYRNWDKFIYKIIIKRTSALFIGDDTKIK